VTVKKTLAFLWTAAVDLLMDAVFGVFWFVLTFAMFAIGLALTPVFGAGLLVLLVASGIARVGSAAERNRAAALYDIVIPAPARRRTASGGWSAPFKQGLIDTIDPVTWRGILHHFLSMIIGVGFLSIITATGNTIVLLRAVPLLPIVIGIAGIAILVGYVAAAGRLDRAVIAPLLGPSRADELSDRVDTLAGARQGAVDGAAIERQRIERDLHDGVQPRLVSVAMILGMARNKFDDDPAGAKALLEQAHAEAKSSITELRQLARGIHPAVLTDRGLDAALSAVASRCPVPATVTVELSERPTPEIEAVVYFTVAEALTNVAKHSGAQSCSAVIVQLGERLIATIRDDGAGGAVIGDGLGQGGLAGVRDRARAAGGSMLIESPLGGPTLVTVEVPCAS
jgi:signal transduction histidine kinase